jgi:putative transposase
MLIAIPPEFALSYVVVFIKGKSTIYLVRVYGKRKRNFVGAALLRPWVLDLDGRTR